MANFRDRMKQLRKERGLSQEELAKRTGSVYQNKIKSMSDYYADKMNDHIDGIMQKKGEAK